MLAIHAGAQAQHPVMGKACPDFTFSQVDHYKSKQIHATALKGKWFVLDFWGKGCTSCVASFPKVNQLQKDFKDDVQFILVADNRHFNGDIRGMYEKFRNKQQLDLAIAYDSTLFEQFGIQTVPYIVIVDPQGTVRAITYALAKDKLQSLMEGNPSTFAPTSGKFDEEKPGGHFNGAKPMLVNGNGGADTAFLFRSMLVKWNKGDDQAVYGPIDQLVQYGCFQVAGVDLNSLYKYAYCGNYDWSNYYDTAFRDFNRFPILEVKDPGAFEPDFTNGKGVYSYSLYMPKDRLDRKSLQEAMQRDLKNYFGYDVSIETRSMPYWRLVATDAARKQLPAKGKPGKVSGGDHAGYALYNIPVANIISIIGGYHQREPLIMDETGIGGNIDIRLDALMTDLEDIKKALRKNGLDMVKGERMMKTLVIRDPS